MTSPISSVLRMVLIVLILVSVFLSYDVYRHAIHKRDPTTNSSNPASRGVIVSLIRSTNRSISLTINMVNSVIYFFPNNDSFPYPFLIFHDENLTPVMRQQILSCILQTKKPIEISFVLADFQTTVKPNQKSRSDKPIGYRLMCRFWTYDVFYHPAIIQGKYDYLMRMDDDSYFSDTIKKDPFLYMDSRKLDYMYRSTYNEPIKEIEPILRRFLNTAILRRDCIYNNFFVIRLKWFYESKPVQNFVRELMYDDLMLREYVGDGCAHSAMLQIDNQAKVEHVTNIPYGHNLHLMPSGQLHYQFHVVKGFNQELSKSCEQLTVIRGSRHELIRINLS
ncbi:unnamed protein product [Rotaria socialis]|uniref:Hexosyltransferase n=1 Tax=Rotaria socialis TaxID=392032 RepID=A0A817UE49_9BILA|nr:unnamed protein product [Rotaria socialis]CAF4128475.1 unnamed protein product [Rotaria socialis]